MHVRSATLIAAVLACLAPGPHSAAEAGAQVIRGVVVDSASQQPLPAVLVSLADSANRTLQRFLADASGEFTFLAPRPGRYSVQAERLGMRTETVEPIDVTADQTISLRIPLAHLPITLRGLEVSGDRRCELPGDLGLETLRVWEEARKVLGSADFTSSAGVYTYDLGKYARELEPGSLKILSESNSFGSTSNERPIESRPVQALLADGWVAQDSGGYRYFGLDAHVLLSDEFLDRHCMRLRARHDSRPDLIGLEFRPVRIESRLTQIQGVLWLSRETGGLEWLEFSYLNLPGPAEQVKNEHIGGRVEFRSLPDGTWIVSKWHIRMPRVVEEMRDVLHYRVPRARLQSIVEVGGWVMEARMRDTDKVAFGGHGGVIAGQVGAVDGDELEPGRVALVGVGVAVDLDRQRRFVISGLPEGTYQLSYLRPSLGGLDRNYALADAAVRSGDTTTVLVQPADAEAVLAQACGLEDWVPLTGVVQGHVLMPGSSVTASGITVVAEWQEWRLPVAGPLQEGRNRYVSTETNVLGAFRLCGVPADLTSVEVTAGEGRTSVSTSTALSDDRPVVRITLRLPGGAPDGG